MSDGIRFMQPDDDDKVRCGFASRWKTEKCPSCRNVADRTVVCLFCALTKRHLRRIMDSSVTLGRLELGRAAVSPGALLNGPGARERSAQQQHTGTRSGPLGCVPLSHQVAGHKYGVDKVGQFTD